VRSAAKSESGKITYSKAPRDVKSDHYGLVITGEPVSYEPALPF
jgi:hypothetical protein